MNAPRQQTATLDELRDAHAKALEDFALHGTPEAWNRASELAGAYQRALGLRPVTVERRVGPDALGRCRYLLKWDHDGAPCALLFHGTRDEVIARIQADGFAVPAEVP